MDVRDCEPIKLDVSDLEVLADGAAQCGFEGDTFRLVCCDCGLTHGVGVMRKKDTGEMMVMLERNDRATAQYRRHGKADLIKGIGKWVMRRR